MKVGILPVLVCNDLGIALKNKTLFLVLFIPLFVFLALKLVDPTEEVPERIRVALIQNTVYPPGFVQIPVTAPDRLAVAWVPDVQTGKRLLKEKEVDGVLSGMVDGSGGVLLEVMSVSSAHTLAIVRGVAALQRETEGKGTGWITEIKTQSEGSGQNEALPTWILMLVLLVGFIVLPAQVAEEKEKKLLLALLQTPMHEIQWLMAKVITGMLLIAVSVMLLHLLGGFYPEHFPEYIAFLLAGGFCFSACGILLGFLCRTQASARTLGLMFYLPNLLPCALSDVSQKFSRMAPFFPSYHFYKPVKFILVDHTRAINMLFEWSGLMLGGMLACGLSFVFMKRRWLMG